MIPFYKKPQFWLALFTVYLAVALFCELLPVYDLNDASLHQQMANRAAEKMLSLENPLDFFFEEWAGGFPLFGHYQMLPHLFVAVLHLVTFTLAPVFWLYKLVLFLLIVFFPASFYYALRRFGFEPRVALWAAIFSPLAQSSIGFGHEMNSYLAIGSGVYTQIFAMHFFIWALVIAQQTLSARRIGYILPVVLLSLLGVSHIFLFYFCFLILALWWLFGLFGPRIASLKRFAFITAAVFAVCSFFFVPMLQNAGYHAFSRYEPLSKTHSYGLVWVIKHWLTGHLLDNGRLPVLTVLGLFGLYAVRKGGREKLAVALAFGGSMALFFGRTTWRYLIDFLPMGSDLHFERFIQGVHIFGFVLAAMGMVWICDRVANIHRRSLRIAWHLFIACCLLAAFFSFNKGLSENRALLKNLHAQYRADGEKIDRVYGYLQKSNQARIFAGHRSDWGRNFRMGGVSSYFLSAYKGLPSIGHLAFGWALPGDFSAMMDQSRPDHLRIFAISKILSRRDDAYWSATPEFVLDDVAVYSAGDNRMIDVATTPILLIGDKITFWKPNARWLKGRLPERHVHLAICFEDCSKDGFDRVMEMTDENHFRLSQRIGNSWNVSEHQVFESPGPFGNVEDYPFPAAALADIQGKAGRWATDVYADEPTVVYLKQTYHPYWRGFIDGQPTTTFMISPGFMALHVPKGKHKVEFLYRPARLKWLLMLLIPVAFIALYLIGRKVETAAQSDPSPRLIALGFCALLAMLLLLSGIGSPEKIPTESIPIVGQNLNAREAATKPERVYIDGITFDHGLRVGMFKEKSRVDSYRLDGRFRRFEAWTGLTSAAKSMAVFQVKLDGRIAFNSGLRLSDQKPTPINLDLTGVKFMELIVINPAEGAISAVWADAGVYR